MVCVVHVGFQSSLHLFMFVPHSACCSTDPICHAMGFGWDLFVNSPLFPLVSDTSNPMPTIA